MINYPIPVPPGGFNPLPTVFGKNGLQQIPPAELRAYLLSLITAVVPGYTANLPGVLIEDILSTDVGALSVIDSARVELLNSLTPYGCNAFILNQLGQIYGVPVGLGSNTSVFVQFTATQALSSGPVPVPGFVINKGFLVSDGQYQYQVVDGGVTDSSGNSPLLYCLANTPGTWAVPAGTVTQVDTSVPSGFSLTVVNPEPGIPGPSDEDETVYRSRVLTAGLAASQGMGRYLKTLLANVPGVQPRLIAVQQDTELGEWVIICGGGDPYQVAYAIYMALFDINDIGPGVFHISGITVAGTQATVSSDMNLGYLPGTPIQLGNVNPAAWDGNYVVYSMPDNKSVLLGVAYPANQLQSLTWAAGVATATTLTNHGVTVGSTFRIQGNLPAAWDGSYTAIAGTTATTLKWNLAANPGAETQLGQLLAGTAIFDATGKPAYVSGGQITPNNRNISVNIIDFPDTYTVTYINPPQQDVTMTVRWNTSMPNFVNQAAIAQAANPALVDYVNSVFVGQPLNLYQMQCVFNDAVAAILPAYLITRLEFDVSINGVGVTPSPGTGTFVGDPQSFFFIEPPDINIIQG